MFYPERLKSHLVSFYTHRAAVIYLLIQQVNCLGSSDISLEQRYLALLERGMIYRSMDIFIARLSRMIEYGMGSSLNFK